MIVVDKFYIGEKEFLRTWSDEGFYIERDGVKYSEACDLEYLHRTYTETDEPIEHPEESSAQNESW